MHVAVAGGPVRELEAGQGLVVDVHGQQVVAGVQPLVDVVEEVRPGQPLPHQPPLQVGDRDDDGVDLARLRLADELLKRDLRGFLLAARLPVGALGPRGGRSLLRRCHGTRHVGSLLLIQD